LRVTNSILAREAITEFQAQTRSLNEARRRAATGQLIALPSDDPVAGAGIMESSSGLRALKQYRSNLETGQARLAIEDSVLEQVTNVLTRARELAASQAGEPATAVTRDGAKLEVDRMIDFVTDLANSKFADSYIFGGQYSDSPPYTDTYPDPLRPPSGSLRMEVGAGVFVQTNHSAQEIFIDSDVVESLRALSEALDLNDPTGVQNAMERLDTSFGKVQELIGDLGGRMNYMETAVANLDSLEVTLQTFRSGLADADLAEAMTDLVNRQTTLEAAMLANSRILDITLADYLR